MSGNQTQPSEQHEPAVVKYRGRKSDLELDVDWDIRRLVTATADLLQDERAAPDLLRRDLNMIADSVQQLGRMVVRLNIQRASNE